jgi:hypothetical protein
MADASVCGQMRTFAPSAAMHKNTVWPPVGPVANHATLLIIVRGAADLVAGRLGHRTLRACSEPADLRGQAWPSLVLLGVSMGGLAVA